MAKSSKESSRPRRPAIDPEAREKQMIALAVDLAEKQLIEGTASSQVITHYLKLATTRERIEQEILKANKALIEAKQQEIQSRKSTEEMYEKAIKAMRLYNGQGDESEYEDDDEYE